jgi:acetyl/propionyl-CoA carboxylase alpha subunit
LIKKLLVANRGEIAVRIIRGAREMGIRTAAVYSAADEHSMHVALADEAHCIGESEAYKSYLNAGKIIETATSCGADAIHPGYGFLSERAEFSDACEKAGILFVGPPAGAMRKLGSKIDAKQLAVENGVPITPGFFEGGASAKQLERAAKQIGYPIMLKASAGGGGRGMRIVRDPSEFSSELSVASDEAVKAFGDGAMLIEKLIERPRHIEVQVLADQHGNIACLFERECSIQRRHQKLIEEAPSALATRLTDRGESFWQEMKGSVERLIKAAGYTNAGTVEFMFDETEGKFYFLEVNARLQVEHPVTEMITGLDLVQWQLRIASGEKLAIQPEMLRGERAAINGHAMEARIVAEDPASNFLPSIGKITAWAEPVRPGVRIDTGFGLGSEVTRFYDSLIAKVIVHADTRAEAIRRMREALLDFHVLGVKTNVGYILSILDHEDFQGGKIDTGFIGRELTDWSPNGMLPKELGAILDSIGSGGQTQESESMAAESNVWAITDGFRNAK